MRVLGKRFEATFKSWDRLIAEAGKFATSVPSENLISISHSVDSGNAVIIVWFRGNPEKCPDCDYDLRGRASDKCPECGTPI